MQEAVEMHYTVHRYLELLDCRIGSYIFRKCLTEKWIWIKAMRNILTQEEFTEDGGKGNVAGWLNTITVENVHPSTTVAIRMKGLAGKTDDF